VFEAEFPQLRSMTYLDWAAVGVPPLRSIGAVRAYLDMLERDPASAAAGAAQAAAKQEARAALAPILGCSPDRIVFTGTSTTSAVQVAVDAVSPSKGDNVVIADMDFPLFYVEAKRLSSRGVEVRVAQNADGDYEIDQFYELIDRRTRAVMVSSVMWVNGLRLDVAELAKVAHEAGAYVIVDAIQQAGALRVEADRLGLDFVAVGSQKWLMAPYGVGALCVGRRAVEELSPPRPGYLSLAVKDWDAFWADPSKSPAGWTQVEEGALKFEYGGTFPPLSLKGLAASASLINELGVERAEEAVLRLRKALVEELEDLRLEVLSPPEARKASGIVLFRVPGGLRENYMAAVRLRSRGVMVSARGAAGVWGIRASVHFPNGEEDVEALGEALRGLRA